MDLLVAIVILIDMPEVVEPRVFRISIDPPLYVVDTFLALRGCEINVCRP